MKSLFLLFSSLVPVGLFAAIGEELPPPPTAGDLGSYQMVIMLTVVMIASYLLIWRPESQRRKALEEQRKGLQKGDKVTAMGIIGTVVKTTDDTVILKMCDGAKIEFIKAAVTDVWPREEAVSKESEGEAGKE